MQAIKTNRPKGIKKELKIAIIEVQWLVLSPDM